MNKLIFEEKRHRYHLEGQEDKPFTGVTSVLSVVAKPSLIQWSANEASAMAFTIGTVPGLKEEIAKYEKITTEIAHKIDKLFPQFKEARTAHNKKKETAAGVGTEVHKAIEEWIKEQKEPSLNEQGMKMFSKFKEWAKEKEVKFLDSERRLYSLTHWIAGTCDFTCEIGGKRYVGDFKTSGGIYGREYFAQCAGYRLMLEEHGGKDFHGAVIVRCGKDGSFEAQESFDYETDKDYFLSALKLYRIINNY